MLKEGRGVERGEGGGEVFKEGGVKRWGRGC